MGNRNIPGRHVLGLVVGVALSLTAVTAAHAFNFADFISRTAGSQSLVKQVMVNGIDISKNPLGKATGFVVQIEARSRQGSKEFHQCLGVAVLADVVLGAGHCLAKARHVTVKFIRTVTPLNFETIEAKDFAVRIPASGANMTMHSDVDMAFAHEHHDFAVILLKKPSTIAAPIPVVPMGFKVTGGGYPGPDFHAFGYRRNESFVIQKQLDYTTFKFPIRIATADHWFRARTTADELICEGDSGAPVTVSGEDVGIRGRNTHFLVGFLVSASTETKELKNFEAALKQWGKVEDIPRCGHSFTFMDVRYELDWIHERLKEMDPANPRLIPVHPAGT